MNLIWVIAKRELTSLFFSPIAYVVFGVFALISSMLFMADFQPGQQASMRMSFGGIVWLLVFVVPAISMRLLSEELRSGTIETLMTSPLSDAHVIVGKWLGAVAFLVVLLSPLVLQAAILEVFASPDYGPLVTGLLGLLLVGALYLAVGTLMSAANENQIIVFLLTLLVTGFLTIGLTFLAPLTLWPERVQETLFYINVDRRFEDFSKGVIDTRNVIFFVTGVAMFLFIAVKVLESKRWR